ncbi:MAG: DNA polymerase III subunit [Chloroflexi bacterium]|nr:DNA polymerase III subunit [Chloroflexota bacterium]
MMLQADTNVGSAGSWQTIGNTAAITLLKGAIDQDRVSHAYLFTGPNRVGKRTLAVDFARALNCNAKDVTASGWADLQPDVPCGQCSACDRIARSNYADVQIITSATQTSKDADAKAAQRRVMIGIDLIKDLQSDAMLEPYEGRAKVFIIDEANRMSPDASNALLKTLEEPPNNVHIVLTSPSADLLPETITSRCHLVRLRPVPSEVTEEALTTRFNVASDEARDLAKMSMGAPGWAIAALNDPSLVDARRQSASRIIDVINFDLPARFDYSFEMSREFRRDRNLALDEVERWLEVVRDIAMIQNGLNQHVTYDDRIQELSELANALTLDEVAAAAGTVRRTRDALMVNALPQLAFDAMMLEVPSVA